MKKRLQGMIAGVLIGAMLTSGVVLAKTGTKNIEVLYNNIKVYKDNVLCKLKDANGTVIEPFIYNGTTYMPVRATANLAGMDVTWDGTTQSVYLWDEQVSSGTYLLDVCPPYDQYKIRTDDFKMSGNNYKGFYSYNGGESIALFNLNGKYSSLTMDIGHVDGSSTKGSSKIEIYLDGKLSKTFEVTADMMVKTVTIPLKNALQMKILVDDSFNSFKTGFGNITIQ